MCMIMYQETKGVTVSLAEYKGGAISVQVSRMEITDAQASKQHKTTSLQYYYDNTTTVL